MNPGFFLTLEGSDGVGKSTQLSLLYKKCHAENPTREILFLHDPGSTPIGEKIRNLLMNHDENDKLVPETEFLLFSASRSELVKTVICPALHRGALILCDRFFDSSIVYQGIARSLSISSINMINEFVTNSIIPNVTFLLKLTKKERHFRLNRRNSEISDDNSAIFSQNKQDRIEKESEAFYDKVDEGYEMLSSQYSDRFIVIDAHSDSDIIANEMFEILKFKYHVFR